MPLLEPDSDGSDEVFMVGQGDPPADQTEAETAQAAEAKIAQAARLAREADKAARKRHHGQHEDSGALEIEADDGTAFGWTTPSSTGIVRSTETDFETTLRLSMRNSNGSSGKVSKSTTSAQCFGLSGHNRPTHTFSAQGQ
jgi:hypothetical protein